MTNLQTGLVSLLSILIVASIPGMYFQSEYGAQTGGMATPAPTGNSSIQRVKPALKRGDLEPPPKPDLDELPDSDFKLQQAELSGNLKQVRGTKEWNRFMEKADNQLELYDVEVPFCIEYRNGTRGFNINTAGENQLTKISGIGPVTANDILSYREKVGSFHSFYEMIDIDNIGASMVEKLIGKMHFSGRTPYKVDKENC